MNYVPQSHGMQQRGRSLSTPWASSSARQQEGSMMTTMEQQQQQDSVSSTAADLSPALEQAQKRRRVDSSPSPRNLEDDFMPLHPPCIQRMGLPDLTLPTLMHPSSKTSGQFVAPLSRDTPAHARIRNFRQFRC